MTQEQMGKQLRRAAKSASGGTNFFTGWSGFLIGAGIVLIILIFGAGILQGGNIQGKDAAAVLTFITAASVGIERVIEGFWTFVGLTKGAFWPLGAFSKQVNDLSTSLDETLAPFYQKLKAAVTEAQKVSGWTDVQLEAAIKQIDELEASVNQIKALTPGSPQAAALASAATKAIEDFQKQYPTIKTVATFANESITGLANFITTPVDNLGRRFISLFAGMALGLVVTGILRLDMVQAIFQTSAFGHFWWGLNFYWGIAFTGIVIGLGSNPTHEVIRVLQEFKNNLKAQQAAAQ